jgi:predicted histone-like DNA-binding protein
MGTIKIVIYQNRNKKSKNYKQFYGRVKHHSLIEPAVLCAHAAQDSGIEEAKVAIVFEGVLKQMKEQLCLGHPIILDEMGTFKIGVTSEGVTAEDVQRRYPQYDPETDDIRQYLSARQVKGAHLLFRPSTEVKTLLRSIKFDTDKTEWASLLAIEKSNGKTEKP